MTINISLPDAGPNLHPKITVMGVGGAGGNAVNNMIKSNLEGVDFIIANTDAQALENSNCERKIQLGLTTIPNDFMSISFVVEQLLGSNDPQYRTSLKYRINNIIYLNTGIQINPNRFGCGIVINKNKFNFSYAYLTHHVLPGTHQFNFGVNF